MRGRLLVVGALALCTAGLHAQRPALPARATPASDASDLPVRRVILYKSGVGFFEHIGSVTGNATVTIRFTTAQLNDVLQSLTALDLDGGSVSHISYNSVAPLEQRLSALRLPLDGDASRLQFFQALRGARVVVRGGGADVSGRIFSIEQTSRLRNGLSEPVLTLTLISDDGSVRTIDLTSTVTVSLIDRDVRDDVGSYLGIVASARAEDARRMTMAATGNGTRRLAVSYVSEVPIWKSTYRLVLPADARPVLQGWAVVDNTVGQDWTNVELSLVAGAPQSFVQQISQPYYAQRPIVPLPPAVLLQPQTHAGTLLGGSGRVRGTVRDSAGEVIPGAEIQLVDADADVVTKAVSDASGNFDIAAPPGAYTLRAELAGFTTTTRPVNLGGTAQRMDLTLEVGQMAETVMVSSAPARNAGGGRGGLPAPPPAPPAPRIDYMKAAEPAAQAQELGELFEYKLTQPVTIRKNESALVPILNAQVDAERISLWNRGPGSGRPLRGVWLTNTSGLTLDGGSFTVVEADAFAGEGLIEPLKPGEKRVMSYGTDLAVLVKAEPGSNSGRITKVVAHDGVIVSSQEDRASWKYTARNEDGAPRTLLIEHPLRPGWVMASDPAPAEMSPSSARYRLALPAKQEATVTVTERHVGDTAYRLTDFDDRTVAILVRGGVPEPALRRALQPLTAKRAELAAADARAAAINAQIAEIGRDQERVRENMKALRGTADEKALTQRYTRQLGEQEDRLATLKESLGKANAEREARRRELNELAAALAFEITPP